VCNKINEGISEHLKNNNLKNVAALVGSLSLNSNTPLCG